MSGLGGTMAILYGQITTNKPVLITSSADGKKRHSFEMIIDIAENKPVVLKRESTDAGGKTGTRVDLTLEGDYLRASQKIIDYLRQTALVASYANLAFVDPQGQLTFFERATTSMPPAPKETLPHPRRRGDSPGGHHEGTPAGVFRGRRASSLLLLGFPIPRGGRDGLRGQGPTARSEALPIRESNPSLIRRVERRQLQGDERGDRLEEVPRPPRRPPRGDNSHRVDEDPLQDRREGGHRRPPRDREGAAKCNEGGPEAPQHLPLAEGEHGGGPAQDEHLREVPPVDSEVLRRPRGSEETPGLQETYGKDEGGGGRGGGRGDRGGDS